MTVTINTDASSVIANKTYYSQNLANCPNPCPKPIESKPSTSFSGNTNMPTSISTKAFRYAQLVSLPFRARGSGVVAFISNNKGINKCVQPPRNTF
jgi:hypothetical protein